MTERLSLAQRGRPEVVRLPIIRRGTWGCDLPTIYVGTDASEANHARTGDAGPWLQLEGQPLPKQRRDKHTGELAGEAYTVVGYFTGRRVQIAGWDTEDSEGPTPASVFRVLSFTRTDRAPDTYAQVLADSARGYR
jgi:hypothetical protein